MIQFVHTTPPDESQKRCYDCYHCQAAVSHWCVNKEACKWRGSNIPGVHDCPFWKPGLTLKDVPWWRLFLFPLNYIVMKKESPAPTATSP